MYTFVAQLRTYLDVHGVPHTADLRDDYDFLFVNSWVVPYARVRHVKETHPAVRVVHRVDGSSMDYGGYRSGDARQARVNLLADLTVFQSAYSKLATTKKFHVMTQDGPVIRNPVDPVLFTPEGARLGRADGRPAVACASWSTNPGKGMGDIDRLAAIHTDVDFVLCGRFEGLRLRDNLIHLGHASRSDIAQALRSCDVFLTLSERDSAPNVVIEALASGLPVLYRDSGGVPELVGDCGLPVTVGTLRDLLDQMLTRREAFARAARERASCHLAPEVVCPQYLAAMSATSRRPLPTRCAFLRSAIHAVPVLS